MIFANRKIIFKGAVLVIALWPGVLAENENNNDSDLWIERARQLQTREFMNLCSDVFLSPDHILQQSYLMSDYADEVTNLCLKIAPNPDQGTCQRSGFGSLNTSLQNAFFRHAAQHMGAKTLPINLMMEWGNAGYIVSDKTAVEREVMRNDLCVEVHDSIGDDFIAQVPNSQMPKIPDHFTKIEQVSKPEPESKPVQIPNKNEKMNEDEPNDNFTVVHHETDEDQILSISAIIAISCAVAAAIALLFYYEARRRNRARINRMSRIKPGNKNFEDGLIKVHTASGDRNGRSFGGKNTSSPVEAIKQAINVADWDGVYKLASRIAETDDGLSLPSVSWYKDQDRSHLGVENQERTKTLDELAANGDWTGLAVTAALYAGETSGSSHIYSDDGFPHATGGPPERRVLMNASENEDVEVGQRSMKDMVSGLSMALNAGDWSQVTKYANQIKDEKNAGSSFDTDPDIIFTDPSTSSVSSSDTTDTEMSKRQTIEKLMRAGKWKGVSIMANMYEMESKQSHPSTSVRPYPPSPTHQYSDTRSPVRTKELRHSDRVQQNIVGFRQDP